MAIVGHDRPRFGRCDIQPLREGFYDDLLFSGGKGCPLVPERQGPN